MWSEILKSLSVYLSSMLKFIFGPLGGKAAGLSMITTMVVTTAGMMTVVIAFTYFGKFIREQIINRFFRRKENKEPGTGRWASFSKKYGIAGVAFLTPLLLTPIGGALLAVSIGGETNRKRIILYMFISASVWSVLLTLAVYLGYDAFMRFIGRLQPV